MDAYRRSPLKNCKVRNHPDLSAQQFCFPAHPHSLSVFVEGDVGLRNGRPGGDIISKREPVGKPDWKGASRDAAR